MGAMPELPEVERVRRTLEPHVVGRVVVGVRVLRRGYVQGSADGASLLVGRRIVEVRRLGKSLALVGADEGRGAEERGGSLAAVGLHLGMTGQVLTRKDDAGADGASVFGSLGHVHVVWALEGGVWVGMRDPRRFGEVRPLGDLDALHRHWAHLGPDALSIDAAALARGLKPGGRAIKASLLDQRVLAGVGNIYADEALFRAGIGPRRRAGGLTGAEVARLAEAVRRVLSEAIEAGGSTLRDFQDADGAAGGYGAQHQVYGRGGRACVVCRGTLRRTVVAQRTTVWCPRCQAARRGGA
jgi:formamidopyrimidine-DNA glycosylase